MEKVHTVCELKINRTAKGVAKEKMKRLGQLKKRDVKILKMRRLGNLSLEIPFSMLEVTVGDKRKVSHIGKPIKSVNDIYSRVQCKCEVFDDPVEFLEGIGYSVVDQVHKKGKFTKYNGLEVFMYKMNEDSGIIEFSNKGDRDRVERVIGSIRELKEEFISELNKQR